MCGYSNEAAAKARGVVNAKQGDNLTMSASFHGFEHEGRVNGPVVCLLNGVELSISGVMIDFFKPDSNDSRTVDCHNTVVTAETREVPLVWCQDKKEMDILVLPDGHYALVHSLLRGTKARVLQVPVTENPLPKVGDALREHEYI